MTENDEGIPSRKIELEGSVYDRIPFDAAEPNDLCFDCDAGHGELHELGCDVEVCPRCGGQTLSCGCSGGSKVTPQEGARLRELIRSDIHREKVGQVINDAGVAFRERRFTRVVELLTPFEADLPEAAHAKLVYARRSGHAE